MIGKSAFALALGLTRERLYNYEEGRSPLPWDLAKAICNEFDVNPLWLATGEGLPFLAFGYGDDLGIESARPRELLSAVVSQFPAGHLLSLRQSQTQKPRSSRGRKSVELDDYTIEMLKRWLVVVFPTRHADFLEELSQIGGKLAAKYSTPDDVTVALARRAAREKTGRQKKSPP